MTNLLFYVAVYFAIGFVWTFVKWTISLLKLRRVITSTEYSGNEDRIRSSKVYDTRKIFSSSSSYPPQAKNNVGLIVAWATFWPVNILWTALSDVLIESYKYLVEVCKSLYDRLSSYILPD